MLSAWAQYVISFFHRREINAIFKRNAVFAIFMALQTPFATMVTLVSVTCMLARGHTLTPQGVFTVYALASAIRKSALEYFAYGVKYLADSLVTVNRFENILLGDPGERENPARSAAKANRKQTGAIPSKKGEKWRRILTKSDHMNMGTPSAKYSKFP